MSVQRRENGRFRLLCDYLDCEGKFSPKRRCTTENELRIRAFFAGWQVANAVALGLLEGVDGQLTTDVCPRDHR